MIREFRARPAATADVMAAFEFINRDSEKRGRAFVDAVERTFRAIAAEPRLGARWHFTTRAEADEVRRRAVAGFRNHLVFYRVTVALVEVLRVIHGARDIDTILASEFEEPQT